MKKFKNTESVQLWTEQNWTPGQRSSPQCVNTTKGCASPKYVKHCLGSAMCGKWKADSTREKFYWLAYTLKDSVKMLWKSHSRLYVWQLIFWRIFPTPCEAPYSSYKWWKISGISFTGSVQQWKRGGRIFHQGGLIHDPGLPGDWKWKMPNSVLRMETFFTIKTTIDFKKGQLLNKLSKKFEGNQFKKVKICFFASDGQTWQPWIHLARKSHTCMISPKAKAQDGGRSLCAPAPRVKSTVGMFKLWFLSKSDKSFFTAAGMGGEGGEGRSAAFFVPASA